MVLVTRLRRRDERGSILVTAAVLLVGVATLAGLAVAGGAVYAADQEGRRAADVAALAGAAALPTINVGSGPNPLAIPTPGQLDTPLGTVDATPAVPNLNQDLSLGACHLVGQHFSNRWSPVTESWQSGPVTCSVSVSMGDPWLDRLADCLSAVNATLTCADDLQRSLTSQLPVPDQASPVVTALNGPLTTAGDTGKALTAQLMAQIQTL